MSEAILQGPGAQAEGLGRVPDGPTVPAAGAGSESVTGPRPWVIHPFLIAAFPIVSLYAHNVYEVQARALAQPMAVALGATFAAWLALRLISGDASKAGLAASLLVASCFGFKGVDEFCALAWQYLSGFWIPAMQRPSPLTSLACLVLVDGLIILLIFWKGRRAARWTPGLNLFAGALVAIPTISAASARLSVPAEVRRPVAAPAVERRESKPDIYFIVLDGYARQDVMKELYGFDNAPFLERLERRGFFVARGSRSNYCQTRLSIASTLNMDYLDSLVRPGSSDLLPLNEAIRGNLVRRTLRPLGYKFVSFATDFEATDIIDADHYLRPAVPRPGFSQLLSEMTPLSAWRSEVTLADGFKALRDRTLFALDQLPEVAAMKEPTFTFAHLLAPHPPFIFGEHGEDVSPRRFLADGTYFDSRSAFRSPEYVREAYRKESIFLTEQIERTIDRILEASPEPPVIVLQSDHGAFLRFHPDDLEATDLRERFSILNCIYAPGPKLEGLSDEMTSVNTFRAILRGVVGADLPPLPDRSYFSTFMRPLNFVDVTDRLRPGADRGRTYRYPEVYPGVDPQL